jgi:branched-chain amino acid transport system substrate-binding protein
MGSDRRALKLFASLAIAVTAIGGATAVGAQSEAGEPVVIGAILPLTGDGSAYGPGMEVAIRAAVDEVNAAGGVMGRELQLVVEDDATNPDQGVRAASKLIDVNKVQAVIGTWASSVTLAVAPLTMDANIIEMNVSGSPKISGLDPRVFRANATDAALAATVAEQLYEDGIRRITVMTNNQAGTIGLAEGVRDSFTAAGGEVLDFIEYADGQPSYTSEVNRAVATEPDLFFLSCYTQDGTLILRSAYEAGATATWAAPAWCLNTQLSEAVGAEVVEGAIAVDLVAVSDSAAFQRLDEAYQAATGTGVFENVYAVHVYDSVLLLALAMEKAGTTEGMAVSAAMTDISNAPGTTVESFEDGLAALAAGEDIDFDGASGPIDFDASNDMAPNVGMFTFTDGQPVLTKTFSPSN